MADVRGAYIGSEDQARAIVRDLAGNGEMQHLVVRAHRLLDMAERARSPQGQREIERARDFNADQPPEMRALSAKIKAEHRVRLPELAHVAVDAQRYFERTHPTSTAATKADSLAAPCRSAAITGTGDSSTVPKRPAAKKKLKSSTDAESSPRLL